MKPKEALVKDGFLPKGSENTRGRLSLAAKARIAELKAAGWDIEDGTGPVARKTEAVKTTGKTEPKSTKTYTGIVDVPEPAREKGTFTALSQTGKSPMSGDLSVCVNPGCNSSLTYCRCAEPRAFTDWETVEVIYFSPVN